MKPNRIRNLFQKNRIIYGIIDFSLVFAISLLSHFTALTDGQKMLNLYALLYSLGVSTFTIVLFIIFRIYKILTTEYGIYDAIKTSIVTFLAHTIGYIIEIVLFFSYDSKLLIPQWYTFILSIIAICSLLTFVRISIKSIYLFISNSKKKNKIPTLIIGAGMVANIIYKDTFNSKNNNKIVAIVDDDKNKIGSLFHGIKIYGPISNIKEIIKDLKIETVIIAISNLPQERLKEILRLLNNTQVRVKRAPLLSEMNGPFDIKTFDVDLNELLGRETVPLDNYEINKALKEKTILITGAGGSIGGELSKQVLKSKPKKIILFDIYENGVYDVQTSLMQTIRNEYINNIEITVIIGSTYNYDRIEQVFKKYRPDFVYHAAAYKHVPLMEDSPQEALRTNIIGTYNVAKLSDKYKAKKMILVSTDKAVRPTNVMGATKKYAEEIIKFFAKTSLHTSYAAVRFGNVLGSNGSVVPLFKKQIQNMGPVTITDKRIIRYFMTIEEAVSLILQCGLYAEKGEIFVLNMGKPVKILTLAEMMIRQAGYKPYEDIKIIEIGLRKGEKLFEELLVDKTLKHVKNNLIYVEKFKETSFTFDTLKSIEKIIKSENIEYIKKELKTFINTYVPQ